jgi:hypothetical protein
MSFTEDELQAFTSILEQRFAIHRQEMEQSLDLRIHTLQQDLLQQFAVVSQEQGERSQQWLREQGRQLHAETVDQLHRQQEQITRVVSQEIEQKQRHIESAVDHQLAAQLSGIEQLLIQYALQPGLEPDQIAQSAHSQLESIEVQTELPWEDLIAMMGKALDERLVLLNDSLQRGVKNLEQYLSVRLHSLQGEIAHLQEQPGYGHRAREQENGVAVQEVLRGIEQLEHIVESMQVAMTANHALLSNRLYHHQHLPLERAHPTNSPHPVQPNGNSSLLAQAKARVNQGLEPGVQISQKEE